MTLDLTLHGSAPASFAAALAEAEARAARMRARVTRPALADPPSRAYATHVASTGIWLLQQSRLRPDCGVCGERVGELAWYERAGRRVVCDVFCADLAL